MCKIEVPSFFFFFFFNFQKKTNGKRGSGNSFFPFLLIPAVSKAFVAGYFFGALTLAIFQVEGFLTCMFVCMYLQLRSLVGYLSQKEKKKEVFFSGFAYIPVSV